MTDLILVLVFAIPLLTVAALHTCEPRQVDRPEVLW